MIKIIKELKYGKSVKAFNLFSMEEVEVIGEQIVMDNSIKRHWVLYNKINYTPKNGKPFIARIENIQDFEAQLNI